MEEKELNLAEILKGHEGEIFYSPIFGQVRLFDIATKEMFCIGCFTDLGGEVYFTSNGTYFSGNADAECMLFPSKEQRDWNKWIEDNKPKDKTPKTWSKYIKANPHESGTPICVCRGLDGNICFEKAAIALIRAKILVKVGYGGNVTNKEWENYNIVKHVISICNGRIEILDTSSYKNLIAFHTEKQAEEFLSYPENVQLIKDLYMME